MTRKDYVALAASIRMTLDGYAYAGEHYKQGREACEDVAMRLCGVFAADNERFDPEVFLIAATGRANPLASRYAVQAGERV